MRRYFFGLPILLMAGCGPAEDRRESGEVQQIRQFEADQAAMEAAPSAPSTRASRDGGPNVGVTAAPGVAFNYRYAFRLPADGIAQVQEAHARACEELGIARCRITGMRYRVLNEDDVEAMLAFKLDPSIARRFGQAGVELVARADGMLVESEISGTDVGTSIQAAGRSIAEMEAELARLEAELARGGKSTAERQQLEYQAQQLRQTIRAQRATREEQQEALASTPMVFNYGSGDLVPGPDAEPTFRETAIQAWENFLQGLLILFVILVTLLPWALLAGLVWWIVARVRRRFARTSAPHRTTTPEPGGLSSPPAE